MTITHIFELVNNKILKILGFVKTHKMEVLLLFNYDKLKAAIEASGKSKTYLCKRLERPPYYLRDVIRQKNNIPDEYQKILATELGVTVEYLNDQDENKPASVSAGELSDQDIRLVKWFRSLPPEKQRAILTAQDAPQDLAD